MDIMHKVTMHGKRVWKQALCQIYAHCFDLLCIPCMLTNCAHIGIIQTIVNTPALGVSVRLAAKDPASSSLSIFVHFVCKVCRNGE